MPHADHLWEHEFHPQQRLCSTGVSVVQHKVESQRMKGHQTRYTIPYCVFQPIVDGVSV